MKLSIALIAGVAMAVAAAGCSGSGKWTVKGNVEGAKGSTLYLEAPGHAGWYALDSTKIGSNGSFAMSYEAPAAPEIYRLRLGKQELYFPIDSIETVTVKTDSATFATDYTLSGSTQAEMMTHVDKRVREAAAAKSAQADSLLKRELMGMILGNPDGLVSYYIVQKRVNGRPLFNPADRADIRVIGAVANAYTQNRPNDPRTAYLKALFLANRVPSARSFSNAPADTIAVNQITYFDIDLYDENGAARKLSDAVSGNRVVVLNFTNYEDETSPALNIELGKLYEQYGGKGLEIYQVGLGNDQYRWRQSATNLPWVTVYQSPASPASNITNYNVRTLPAMFVIANGDITDRITDINALPGAVRRHL